MKLSPQPRTSRPFASRRAAHRGSGFTLIELMIVVAIIGILAAVALPAYRDYVTRSKFAEATATLSDLRIKMEQYYQDNRNYGTTAAACPAGVAMPTTPAVKYFTYTCGWGALGTNQGYLLTATGNAADAGGLGAMSGFVFTIDQSNSRATTVSSTAGKGSAGWTGNATCWALRKDGSC